MKHSSTVILLSQIIKQVNKKRSKKCPTLLLIYKVCVYVLNKPIMKQSQTTSKCKKQKQRKRKDRKCSFELNFSSRLSQLQNLA